MANSTRRQYLRFPLHYRFEHWVVVISFITLAITGLAQKYAGVEVSKAIIRLLGGIDGTRTIHHIFATVLMVEVVYHLGAIIFRLYVLRLRPTMAPGPYDVRAAVQTLLYNIGLSKTRPQQGRYTFEEKMEYWAMVWGTIIMVITGFMMWNPLATTRIFPGEFIPAAKTAHGGEALLAVLAIIIWHVYNVHVRMLNRSMFTGKMSEEEMLHEHPLELADIKAGIATRQVFEKEIQQRKKIFYSVYGILGILLLFGVYRFITFEQTAVAQRPEAETVVVYSPLPPTPLPTMPPTPTALPVTPSTGNSSTPATWEGGIGTIFQDGCSKCHGSATQLHGLNMSSYQSALAGGQSGPGIVPGKPDLSQVYILQSSGNHPGQLSPDELAVIRKWIEAGAPEK